MPTRCHFICYWCRPNIFRKCVDGCKEKFEFLVIRQKCTRFTKSTYHKSYRSLTTPRNLKFLWAIFGIHILELWFFDTLFKFWISCACDWRIFIYLLNFWCYFCSISKRISRPKYLFVLQRSFIAMRISKNDSHLYFCRLWVLEKLATFRWMCT